MLSCRHTLKPLPLAVCHLFSLVLPGHDWCMIFRRLVTYSLCRQIFVVTLSRLFVVLFKTSSTCTPGSYQQLSCGITSSLRSGTIVRVNHNHLCDHQQHYKTISRSADAEQRSRRLSGRLYIREKMTAWFLPQHSSSPQFFTYSHTRRHAREMVLRS